MHQFCLRKSCLEKAVKFIFDIQINYELFWTIWAKITFTDLVQTTNAKLYRNQFTGFGHKIHEITTVPPHYGFFSALRTKNAWTCTKHKILVLFRGTISPVHSVRRSISGSEYGQTHFCDYKKERFISSSFTVDYL